MSESVSVSMPENFVKGAGNTLSASRWVTLGELSAETGVPVRVIRRLPLPSRGDGASLEYEQPASARVMLSRVVNHATNDHTPRSTADADDPQLRKQRADARRAEIEVERLERSIVRVEEADAVVEKLLTDLRAQLISFPRRVAPQLLTAKGVAEMEQRLDAAIHRTMEALSQPTSWTEGVAI